VLSHDGRHVSDVVLLHGAREVPIYAQLATLGHRVAVLVEGYAIPIWIRSPAPESDHDARNRRSLAYLADMIVYWLWQFTPELKDCFDRAVAPCRDVFVISIATDEPLDDPSILDVEPLTSSFDLAKLDSGPPDLKITFHASVSALLDGPGNDGEKHIMSAILGGMREHANTSHQLLLSDERVTRMIAAYMEPPHKKKVIISLPDRNPELDPRGLPDRRTVDPCDENELLDELGLFLTEQQGLEVGEIPDERRTAVLNDVVGWYYGRLESLVRTLNPDGLLEWLVAHHEALLYENASSRLTLATRLACFETQASLCDKWAKEYSELAKAAVANRLVIEYVAACPPQGIRPISASVDDCLLAIASEIISVGFQSDIVHFELCDSKLSILRSGRLGRNFDEYEAASRAYTADYTEADITGAAERFAARWVRSISPESRAGLADLDEAAREEYGHTFTDLRDFWGVAGAVAAEVSPVTCRIPKEAFARQIAEKLRWDRATVHALIDDLSIGERSDFLSPPPPFRPADVYPWRFTRAYSYLRKPLLVVSGREGPEIVTGHRHLHQSWRYLARLCLDGRLKARSPRMQSLMSHVNCEKAEAFNDSNSSAVCNVGVG